MTGQENVGKILYKMKEKTKVYFSRKEEKRKVHPDSVQNSQEHRDRKYVTAAQISSLKRLHPGETQASGDLIFADFIMTIVEWQTRFVYHCTIVTQCINGGNRR